MKGFIYTTTLNHRAVLESGVDLEIDEEIIFWLFASLNNSTHSNKIIFEGRQYVQFTYALITEQLPRLKLKPDTLYRKVKRLCELNLLEKCPTMNQYYSVGPAYDVLVGFKSEGSEKNPVKAGFKSEGGSDLNPTYNSIKYNKSIKQENTGKNFSFRDETEKSQPKNQAMFDEEYFNSERPRIRVNPKRVQQELEDVPWKDWEWSGSVMDGDARDVHRLREDFRQRFPERYRLLCEKYPSVYEFEKHRLGYDPLL